MMGDAHSDGNSNETSVEQTLLAAT